MIGYRIEGHDNGSFAFHGRTDVQRCPACHALTNKWAESLDGYKIHKLRNRDISATYDGVLTVTQRFKDVCIEAGIKGAEFIQLPDDPGFYRLDSSIIVEFDTERARTRFTKKCEYCEQYESVTGTTPFGLKSGQILPLMSIARTDIEFASLDEKFPIIICDENAGEVLKRAKLKGLDLMPFQYDNYGE